MKALLWILGLALWGNVAAETVIPVAPVTSASEVPGQVTLAWDLPKPDDPRVVGFAIYYRPVGVTLPGLVQVFPGRTTTTGVVTGLTPGVKYEFMARAIGGPETPANSRDSNTVQKVISGIGVPPTVTLEASVLGGPAPLPVQFTGTVSEGTFVWFFGDNAQDNTTLTPQHTYTKPGRYTVTLRGYSIKGTAYKSVGIVVTAP